MNPLSLALLLWQVTSQPQQSCVVLKRMGPADQVTSHLYSFGIRGKQFQYVEGELPKGVKFHGRLTDNDVRKIKDAGGRVTIVDSHYTDQELAQARKSCALPNTDISNSGNLPKADPKASDNVTDSVGQPATPQNSATPSSQPAANPSGGSSAAETSAEPPPGTVREDLTTAVLKSDPAGADVTLDGKYMGSTPSTVRLTSGDHKVLIEKSGYKPWQRTVTVNPGGIVTIEAALEKNP